MNADKQTEQLADMKLSPFRMLVVLMVAVFAIELSVMFAFELFPGLPLWLENLLDASTLVALLFPTLYFSVFRPLTRLVDQYAQMEIELREHRDHLEDLVEVRTEQVNQYVKLHEEEDALAAYVMDRYLHASHSDPRVEYSILSASHHFSGDAISVALTPDGGLNVMMLDAMGHGLSAAINVLPAIQAFYSMSRKGIPLAALIPEINDKVRELSPSGRFLAGTFLHLNATATELSGWIGGTPKIYLYCAGEILPFSSGNLALGIMPSDKLDFEYFSAPWSAQSMLVTCTDGVIESSGWDGKELGEQWLCGVIQAYGNALDKRLFDQVWKTSLGNNKPLDDASILIINQALVAATHSGS